MGQVSREEYEAEAAAEIFTKVAEQAVCGWDRGRSYEVLTDAERAADLAELAEDNGEAWFAFYPFGRRADAEYGWGTRAEALRYQALINRGLNPDEGEWFLMDRVDDAGGEDFDGFNISDFFAGNPDAEDKGIAA
ncbi:hypothetical protein C5748_07365 [Phyllobacterium phragmitis]|uniref:Uncharacterized protein n=1 Tax=Phyllobacterium phragmitis TaxID=2670329 RepID=A0A2S9IV20_9HYPH|nr:hypothetical protein [Phyllobacterium phragmitis]PRD44389.1 hypothetical protein C5748_07365 [Phyllobacterium phragmitis]